MPVYECGNGHVEKLDRMVPDCCSVCGASTFRIDGGLDSELTLDRYYAAYDTYLFDEEEIARGAWRSVVTSLLAAGIIIGIVAFWAWPSDGMERCEQHASRDVCFWTLNR